MASPSFARSMRVTSRAPIAVATDRCHRPDFDAFVWMGYLYWEIEIEMLGAGAADTRQWHTGYPG